MTDHCNCPWRCSSLRSVGVVIPLPVNIYIYIYKDIHIYRWWLFRLGAIYCTASKLLSWYIPETIEDSQRNQPSQNLKIFYWYKKKLLNHYQYMTWPLPGYAPERMAWISKQPTMSCQRPYGSRNRTNYRSIKNLEEFSSSNLNRPQRHWIALLLIPCPSDDSSLRKCAEHRFVPSTSSDPKVLSNLSTASGYPKLSGDDPTRTYWNILKHY